MDAKEALKKLGGQKKSNKAKGLPKRTGKRAAKYAKYFNQVRKPRKIRRILRHNGRAAAKAWADANSCLSIFTALTT